MAWIKTVPFSEADETLRQKLMDLRASYPAEYEASTASVTGTDESIMESHSLMPDAMFHSFAAFAAMMSPELPLERRQHEMIATMVSSTNDCFY